MSGAGTPPPFLQVSENITTGSQSCGLLAWAHVMCEQARCRVWMDPSVIPI